ncbi:hypothetical protein HUT03_00115 [Candidatus Liberibacter africanus]|uniref:hypothetical protein n=1 Tax=Liberibacter africanus TaxID=34020 RepID=UPI001AEB0799|nr:hypothetical protein [Candidatus Liberibacter africanus]QTP63572.1 hypothetical protein HUT03_00115 [Candidatus Liberibacter africanus]
MAVINTTYDDDLEIFTSEKDSSERLIYPAGITINKDRSITFKAEKILLNDKSLFQPIENKVESIYGRVKKLEDTPLTIGVPFDEKVLDSIKKEVADLTKIY